MLDMTQQRQNNMLSEEFGDTTYSKIFVGGLAWKTQRDTMKNYFEQFGEILEAVIIADRRTGKSKGYGFVSFKDSESARKACQINPFPVIDGRRANCNLANIGAQKNRPQHGTEKSRQAVPSMAPSDVHDKYIRQPVPQYAFSCSAYGYPTYSPHMNPLNYYNACCGGQQQLSSYCSTMFPGVYLNDHPFYGQQEQSSPVQHTKIVQFPYLPQQYRAFGIPSLPSAAAPSLAVTGGGKVKINRSNVQKTRRDCEAEKKNVDLQNLSSSHSIPVLCL